MNPIGQVINLVLEIFILLLLIRLIVDWIQFFARSWSPKGPVLLVLEGVYSATDPPIHAFRRVFKPIRIGGVALDLSFLAVLLVCYLLLRINTLVWTA
ncbi:YggT family protein [Marmoricola sp. RAF53]|uniref:YggT family protein n=1 Tax=Marmoricola sp. RAF53 TaxID=3233059 RepID=UPI003F9B717F